MQQASQAYLDEVRTKWESGKAELFVRDGTNEKFNYGGHDIKNNQKLQETLQKIAEGYIPFCARKAELYEQNWDIDQKLLGVIPTDEDVGSLTERGVMADAEIANIDQKLLAYNLTAFKALIHSPEESGLQQELERCRALGANITPELRRQATRELVGATIRVIATSCRAHIHDMRKTQGFVPTKLGDDGDDLVKVYNPPAGRGMM